MHPLRVAATVAVLMVCIWCLPADASGTSPVREGGEVTVNTYFTHEQADACIVRRPDGKFVVAWDSYGQDGSKNGVYYQMCDADGTKLGTETQVNTYTDEAQRHSRVAVATDNSFVIVWESNGQDRSNLGVYSQRFDSNGSALGSEFRVNNDKQGRQDAPDVAILTNGEVVYTWSGVSSGTQRIFLRRYDANFSPLTGDVIVDAASTEQHQYRPRIAALSGGGFVVVWYSKAGGASDSDARGQIFTAGGANVGPQLLLNTHTASEQEFPAVAALPNGGFITAWESELQDGDREGVFAQEFSATGTKVGVEFQVNEITAWNQMGPAIAVFHDGSFVIAWYGAIADPAGAVNVGVRHFDSVHNTIGAELLVNTHTDRMQTWPAIAANAVDGRFAVVWTSMNLVSSSPASLYDIGGQWYTADLVRAAPPTQVPCKTDCMNGRTCPNGDVCVIFVEGVASNAVWGDSFFTDDSNFAAAAVFMGLVSVGETAFVTVRVSGPQSSFASGSANGITTQAFASPWPRTFTFDLAGATVPPPPPAPKQCFNEPCAVGKCAIQGTSFDIIVVGAQSGNVWGTDIYSDDSSVAAAAVHLGLAQVGASVSVTVACAGPQSSFTGSERNGVVTQSYGPWDFSFVLSAGPTAPPVDTSRSCVGPCVHNSCAAASDFYVRVAGTTYGYLWGSGPYSDDTTVAAAAVHAGLVSQGAVGIVRVSCAGAQSSFTGSTQNGVTTQSYGAYPASFTLAAGTNMPAETCAAGQQCLLNLCTVVGRVIKLSVTGSTSTASQFWGSNFYSDDSPASHAAVHSGLVQDGETKVLYATCEGPQDAFVGTTAHGITSQSYASPWPSSYTLADTL